MVNLSQDPKREKENKYHLFFFVICEVLNNHFVRQDSPHMKSGNGPRIVFIGSIKTTRSDAKNSDPNAIQNGKAEKQVKLLSL